jgi:hypothetical protein
MSKPATITIAVVGAGAFAVLVVLILNKGQRPTPAQLRKPQAVVESVSSAPGPAAPETIKVKPESPLRPFVARSAPQARMAPDAGKPLDEQSLLTELHDLAASDPPLSLKLAREAVERFPESPNAPEFEWNVVKALFNMRRLEDAEDEARIMLDRYPDSYFTGDVVHHLLNHPPNPSEVPP